MKPVLAYGPSLRTEIDAFIQAKQTSLTSDKSWGSDFLDRLRPFATTGKLLRGSLVCYSYKTFSQQPPNEAVTNAAMALELTHSGLLIHDDIMDADELRRGQPSLHRQYQTAGEKTKLIDAPQFGINMAICGGDIAFFLAFELLGSSRITPKIQAKVHQLFTDQLVNTCIGQMQDVYFEARMTMPSKSAIYGIMRAKTAAYTLALPLAMGAALADQPVSVLRRLEAIGTAIGTIFQIRDDELGVMGDQRVTGKPVGADIREGKKTLLHYYLMKHCAAKERLELKKIFGNPAATPANIAYVQKLVKQHAIVAKLDDEINRLAATANQHITKLSLSDQAKAELNDLVTFCGNRSL